jgi:hypothetical protein
MKFASKLVMAVAMSATALTALAGMASAQETYAVTKYEYSHTDGVDARGLSFGLSGRYDSGLAYDMELMSADIEGVAVTGADLELAYRFSGIAGPVALYEVRDVAGVDSDQLLLGIEGGMELSGADVFAKLLIDTDDQDVYRFALGGGYVLSNDLSLNGKLTHFQNGDASDSNLFEVGIRHRLAGNMHADVGAHYDRVDGGDDRSGLHLGLGFDF